nr:transposase [Caryophanon latum]
MLYRISRARLSHWIWRGFNTLTEEQKEVLRHCQQLYPFLQPIEQLIQSYRSLFDKRDVKCLLNWMNRQLTNKNSPLYRYSIGLRLDLAAVKNAFQLPYSNGLVEGQVNRLKWLKRMMYGRAKPDLLEKRMQYRL